MTDNTSQRIGHTLKLIRVAADRKHLDLARALGVTANYLSLVEHGHRDPSLKFLKQFAQELKVPLRDYLWLALGEETR